MANTPKKGDIEPKAESPVTLNNNPVIPASSTEKPSDELAGNVNNNPQPATVAEVVAFEESIVKPHGEAIIKLDKLLIESEARSTIYCLALGLIAKQARAVLKKAHPKKKQSELLSEFINGLKLSAGRSVRTVERYMEVAQNMIDDGTLKGVLQDSLRAANFTDDVKAEVLQATNNMGITDLYVKYDMIADKKDKKVKVEKSIEDQLMDEVIALVDTHMKLTKKRAELVAAGKAIEPALDELLSGLATVAGALAKHPVIAAKLKKLEDDQKAEGGVA